MCSQCSWKATKWFLTPITVVMVCSSGTDTVSSSARIKKQARSATSGTVNQVKTRPGSRHSWKKYLNGARIGGKDSATANGYREQMALLEDQFNKWIKTHDRYDELVAKYNDVFNSNIPYEHSGDPLGLKGLSGKRQPFDYQNSEVRRLSEDGRGILGFGTGLGKNYDRAGA